MSINPVISVVASLNNIEFKIFTLDENRIKKLNRIKSNKILWVRNAVEYTVTFSVIFCYNLYLFYYCVTSKLRDIMSISLSYIC